MRGIYIYSSHYKYIGECISIYIGEYIYFQIKNYSNSFPNECKIIVKIR